MSEAPHSHSVGVKAREATTAIANMSDEEQVVLPLLSAGKGNDNQDPAPGSPEWEAHIQQGLDLAAAADPPEDHEIAIWTAVAERQLPLNCVDRDSGGVLQLREPPMELTHDNMDPAAIEHFEIGPELQEMSEKAHQAELAAMYVDGAPDSALPLSVHLFRATTKALQQLGMTVILSPQQVETGVDNLKIVTDDEWEATVEEYVTQLAMFLTKKQEGVVLGGD